MTKTHQRLKDDDARQAAMAVHHRSFLVEAGAGSGKTAVMAGRVALMLAEGVQPKRIAAVTFTEFAASELLIRIREFVSELAAGRIPTELRVALPSGLSQDQLRQLSTGSEAIDEITCTTIHGFCQRLIRPYPVEANIDPGATVIDENQADLVFDEIVDAWLREELAGEAGGLLAELVLRDPHKATKLIRVIFVHCRSHRSIGQYPLEDVGKLELAFRKSVYDFAAFLRDAEVHEEGTGDIVDRFSEMAEEVAFAWRGETPAALVGLLLATPPPDLVTQAGGFSRYRKKGKWAEAAKEAGWPKAVGDRLNMAASAHYEGSCNAWTRMRQAAATRVLADLIQVVRPALDRFREYKRAVGLLDFDDLIFSARDLLRDHDAVRRALAARFAHVLVDEFQDTDPLQSEIFWRLCGDPPDNGDSSDWTSFRIRPGALFLVGDPKQAIYRFRGADIAAYIHMREAMLTQDPSSILRISTNFRSCAPIVRYVNERFEAPLSTEKGQPGFTALEPLLPERVRGPSVAALKITVVSEQNRPTTAERRNAEAEAVAQMCARLIGSESIRDHQSGALRLCEAGDIALLAPTGTELWRYEEALERYGIPVATQAGKGLFRRQEVQDLIVITRVLADSRDTLALGALLRGPLVGLTDEELLDIVWELSRAEDGHGPLQWLDLRVDPEGITHAHARDIIDKLQTLQRRANVTTPHALLSEAVDVLRVRPILLQRHNDQAERALANVDLYLSFSRSYEIRGLRAFAEAMTQAWTDESRATEGRPDAQEEAVALYTMHAAKGLEWPIVIPINTMTRLRVPEPALSDRTTGCLYCPVLGAAPNGYEAALDSETAELDRERLRLWYVATSRARELLVLPRFNVSDRRSSWISLVDLAVQELAALELGHLPADLGATKATTKNIQTRHTFAQEAAVITRNHRSIVWTAPSRDESADELVSQPQEPETLDLDVDGMSGSSGVETTIRGGRERGIILHKLIEEVLTGETAETQTDLVARAEFLICALGQPVAENPAEGLNPVELAGCVVRALSHPEIVALRPDLLPEFPVYASKLTETHEEVSAGIVDAIAFDSEGSPTVVIDWKSDVSPTRETLNHYRSQVREYLNIVEGSRGLVVLVTSGKAIPVARPEAVSTS